MITQSQVDLLRDQYNDAEFASQDALRAMATAKLAVKETKWIATRARIRYHRALGALVASADEAPEASAS